VLRIGLGLQGVLYAVFLRSDWQYLFASTGKGLVSRELGEAISSFDSPLIPKLGWLVALGSHIGIGEEAMLSIAWACLLCMGLLCSSQIPSSYPRDFNLPNRTWLCSFHLDEKDSVVLAGLHSGDACRHRIDNGPVSFCPCHDRVEPCCVRRRFRSSFPKASSK